MGYGKYGHAPDFAQMDHERLESYAMACQYEVTHERSENARLRELVKDIDEVADPPLREFIVRRMHELGIEVD